MVLAGGLSGWAALGAGAATAGLAWLGTAATLLVASSLIARSAPVLAGGVAGVVGVVAMAVALRPTSASLVAGTAAYAMAELAFTALDQGPPVTSDPGVEAERWRFVGMVAVVAATVGGLALGAAGAVAGGGLGLEVVGMAGVAGLVALALVMARRIASSAPTRGPAGPVSPAADGVRVGSVAVEQRRGRSVDEA